MSDSTGKDLLISCSCNSEIMRFSQFEDEEEWYITVYNYYNYNPTIKERLKMIWKIIKGEPVVANEIIVSNEEFQKIKNL